MVDIDGIVFSLQRRGGVSTYFHELLRFISARQQEATCLLEEPALQVLDGIGKPVRVTRRPARPLERYRACRSSPDSVVFHSSYYRLPDRKSVATVTTVYDFVYERWQRGPRLWVHRAQKTRAIRAAQAVICISQSTKDDLLEFVGETPGQQIHVIHCGVSDHFHPVDHDPPEMPYVLFVGERRGYKNFRQVIDAMTHLSDVELHCVGGGPIHPDELRGVAGSVAARVRHLGFVTDEQLNVAYCGALCLAYPSLYEGFGIPVLEAMRAGCPVVTRDCKAVVEVGEGALTIVRSADPREMAGAIRSTISERANLIEKGFGVARQYSWDAAHTRTLAVYKSLAPDI